METKPSLEESFRESLKDLVALVVAMGGHVSGIPELLETVKLALENDVHLRLVLSVVQQAQRQRR